MHTLADCIGQCRHPGWPHPARLIPSSAAFPRHAFLQACRWGYEEQHPTATVLRDMTDVRGIHVHRHKRCCLQPTTVLRRELAACSRLGSCYHCLDKQAESLCDSRSMTWIAGCHISKASQTNKSTRKQSVNPSLLGTIPWYQSSRFFLLFFVLFNSTKQLEELLIHSMQVSEF